MMSTKPVTKGPWRQALARRNAVSSRPRAPTARIPLGSSTRGSRAVVGVHPETSSKGICGFRPYCAPFPGRVTEPPLRDTILREAGPAEGTSR